MKLIPLTQGKFAQVDDDDYVFLMQWKWYAVSRRHTCYACRNAGTKNRPIQLAIQNQIMPPAKGMRIDHIDNNGLNNQKTNLREGTKRQNSYNKKPIKGKYKGVYRNSSGFYAQIKINGKNVHLGSFKTAESAALAYNKRASQIQGTFAYLNKVNAETYSWPTPNPTY